MAKVVLKQLKVTGLNFNIVVCNYHYSIPTVWKSLIDSIQISAKYDFVWFFFH